MLADLWAQLRIGVRGVSRAPVLPAAAIICLGLGIGASTAIYSAVHTALLEPLPFAEPDRLVSVFRTTPHFVSGPFAPGNFLDLRERTTSLDGLAAVATGVALLHGVDEPIRVSRNWASGNLFRILGANALLGRLLQDSDEDSAQPLVAVISHEMWRDRFGSDTAAVGRTILLDGEAHQVVGVLPPGFVVPRGNQRQRADVWVPLRFTADQTVQRRSNYLGTTARLAPGVRVEAAEAELKAVMGGMVDEHPELRGEQLRVTPMHRESVRAVRRPLLLLLGSVGLVLLIAVANVASLLLARGVARREELAVRAVLGANRRLLVRPVLVESSLLAGAGALLGLGLAWVGVRAISRLVPSRLPQLAGLELNGAVLGFAFLLSALVAAACAIAPAWQATAGDPQDALRSGGRGGTGGQSHRWLRALVTTEVALSLVLLLGAGLVMQGFRDLVSEDPGFDPDPMLTLAVNVDPDRYGEAAIVEQFLEPALDRIRAIPGVLEAGALNRIPYQDWGSNFNIRYEGQDDVDPTQRPLVESRTSTPEAFQAIGHRLMRGRLLSREDGPEDEVVVVANQALAERDFGGGDPIGKRFHLSDSTFATIVGVVSDIKNFGPERDPRPEVYFSYRQLLRSPTYMPLLVRVSGEPASFARQVTEALREVDPTAAVSGVRPMVDVMSRSVGRARFYLALLGIFAGVALALALAGLYGVMNYTVAQRTRELGIRSALGSTPARTVAMMMRQGLGLVAIGLAVGLLAAFGLTRLLSTLLFGVSPLDARIWITVPLLLAGATLVAILVPARRASTIAPMVAIREE
jgi:putative ABC transport system permease protein